MCAATVYCSSAHCTSIYCTPVHCTSVHYTSYFAKEKMGLDENEALAKIEQTRRSAQSDAMLHKMLEINRKVLVNKTERRDSISTAKARYLDLLKKLGFQEDDALAKIELLVNETAIYTEVRCTSVYCSSAHRSS